MPENIKFSNPDVDARFVALISVDKHIQRPGTYNGKLSNITLEMAEGMIARGTNLIAEKPVAEKKQADPPKKKEEAKPE